MSCSNFTPAAHHNRPVFHLVLDFHTLSQDAATRLVLRDVAFRFLQKLFLYPPPQPQVDLCVLAVTPITHAGMSPSLSLLAETAALQDQRNLSTAQSKFRHITRPLLNPTCADLHANSVVNALLHWGVTDTTIVTPCGHIADHMQQAISTRKMQATVLYADCKDTANTALHEIMAKAHQTNLTLTLPADHPTSADTIVSSVLKVHTRPRILTTSEAPKALIATRLVLLDTLPCDVQSGPPRLLWGHGVGSVCKQLNMRKVGMVCVEGMRLFVVIPGANGMGLLKEVGDYDSILPIPVVEQDGVEAVVRGLSIDAYDAWQVGLGRAKGWGGGRVGFERIERA